MRGATSGQHISSNSFINESGPTRRVICRRTLVVDERQKILTVDGRQGTLTVDGRQGTLIVDKRQETLTADERQGALPSPSVSGR